MEQTKYLLDDKAIPESWYNLVPDLPFQLEPPLNPATMEPVGPKLSPRSSPRPSSSRR